MTKNNFTFNENDYSFNEKAIVTLSILRTKILPNILPENIHEESFIVINDNVLELFLKHEFDNLRQIYLKLNGLSLKIETCFMSDSIAHQIQSGFIKDNSYDRLINDLLFAVFSGDFYKIFFYHKNKLLFKQLKYDNASLRSKTFYDFFGFFRHKILMQAPDHHESYRYLSFFKKYETAIKNTVI